MFVYKDATLVVIYNLKFAEEETLYFLCNFYIVVCVLPYYYKSH